MKIIIAGGRDFNNLEYMTQVMTFLGIFPTEVVSGGQKSYNKETNQSYGADYLGEKWAAGMTVPIKTFSADWITHGRAAGPIRNGQMADYADFLVAFWDGKSRGTKNMIDQMIERKKPYTVFFY